MNVQKVKPGEDADGVGEIMSLTSNCSFHLFIKGRETEGIQRVFSDTHPHFTSYKSLLVLINFGWGNPLGAKGEHSPGRNIEKLEKHSHR